MLRYAFAKLISEPTSRGSWENAFPGSTYSLRRSQQVFNLCDRSGRCASSPIFGYSFWKGHLSAEAVGRPVWLGRPSAVQPRIAKN